MTTDENLLESLRSRLAPKRKEWLENLESRKREEMDFHNFEREKHDPNIRQAQQSQNVHANKKYYSINDSTKQYIAQWLARHVPGKGFLDYACGNGSQALAAARLGASLAVGLDLSDLTFWR